MNKPLLSICYPTYNRADIVYSNVDYILRNYEDDNIEVVVLNNNSEDDTEEKILSIKDERLVYYCNEKNIGSGANLLSVLRRAQAPYALLVSDEDVVDPGAIKHVITIIKRNPAIGMIYAGAEVGDLLWHEKSGKYRHRKAIEKLYKHTYMSGLIYNVKEVCYELDGVEDAHTIDNYGAGYGFLMLALLLAGKHGVICTDNVICKHIYEGTREFASLAYLKSKSNTEYELRLEQTQRYVDVLKRIPLSYVDKSIILNKVLADFLIVISLSHVLSMKNPARFMTADGKSVTYPPMDLKYKPGRVSRLFAKEYYSYVFSSGLISPTCLIQGAIMSPTICIESILRVLVNIYRAEKMMKALKQRI